MTMGAELYCGIDLHSNNGYYGIVDKDGKRLLDKRLPNELGAVLIDDSVVPVV